MHVGGTGRQQTDFRGRHRQLFVALEVVVCDVLDGRIAVDVGGFGLIYAAVCGVGIAVRLLDKNLADGNAVIRPEVHIRRLNRIAGAFTLTVGVKQQHSRKTAAQHCQHAAARQNAFELFVHLFLLLK